MKQPAATLPLPSAGEALAPSTARSVPNRLLPRALMAPAVITLFLWMIVPLVMTIYFSLIRYNLMQPGETGFAGLANYEFFVTDPSFATVTGGGLTSDRTRNHNPTDAAAARGMPHQNRAARTSAPALCTSTAAVPL